LNVDFPKSFNYSWGFPLVEGQTFSVHSFESIPVAGPIIIRLLVKGQQRCRLRIGREKEQ